MTPLLLSFLVVLVVLIARWMRASPEPLPVEKKNRPKPARPAVRRAAPKLESLDFVPTAALPVGEAIENRIRDRYAAVRFPGVFSGTREKPDRVIEAARLYFEEDKFDRAQELLALAIARSPREPRLRLAQLEIAFLMREGTLFTRLADEFRGLNREHAAWPDVARLGRAIAPAEALFGAESTGRDIHEHYGPWPHMPNWIQASWDLTSEVLASDFHRAMNAGARSGQSRSRLQAA
jgi:hypothetical protein